ncbi:MAG TPA: diguanylate cyclase [Steroidobacteraceae bacterium]|jgi:diguanylate cyclase|nr:diguanylate cyclase [Steroidobacteraceae bacterium]
MGFEGARDQSGKRDIDLRQKYFDAIAQLEAGEARWSQLEVTLRRLIGRLCLAARGRATLLDIELRKVSDLARGRGDMSAIEESLEPLSRAIAALDDATLENSGATTTSRALAYSGYVPPSADTSGLRPELRSVPASLDLEDDEAKVQAIIVAVLERLSRLPELRPALGDLCERPKDSLSPEEFAEGLERVARLVGEQRATLMREKREIETLLQQMDLRLAEIASYLASDCADQKSAQTSSQQFDLLVTGEVRNLSNDVQSAGDLAGLRNRVRDRLAIIANHLQDFRTREGARVNAQLDRTQRMRVRVTDLEREIHGLHKSLQEEQSLRMIDALTGIPNRAAYDDRIQHEFMRWQRENTPVSVLAWDIDRFKEINDAYGHSAGDKVLRVIAQHLAQHVRGTDFVARYGGEEFVMLLVGTDAAQAAMTADKIRAGIENMGFHFHNKPVAVTASCGITTFRGDDTPDTIFDRADRALYRAKDGGRNCCRTL